MNNKQCKQSKCEYDYQCSECLYNDSNKRPYKPHFKTGINMSGIRASDYNAYMRIYMSQYKRVIRERRYPNAAML